MTGPTPSSATRHVARLDASLIFLMAACAGGAVANNYYNQPLLPEIAQAFGAQAKTVGLVAGATQIGYAAGLFLIAPLGDRFERKRLTLLLYVGLVLALLAAAAAPTLPALIGASLFIGLFATIVQQIIPFAATLAGAERRGRVVGSIMTGMTLGILLARTVSGAIGAHLGWRATFLCASALSIGMAILLGARLPRSAPTTTLPYPQLLRSMLTLLAREPVLREAALVGALWFASFGAFWATLAAHLNAAPFHYGPEIAGLFGLVGVAGASATRISGHWADRIGSRPIIGAALGLLALSFVILMMAGDTLWGLIVGIILLDFAVFGAQVANQARVFSVQPDARSRVNGIYMVCYYAGGALGSSGGSLAWQLWRWTGVCGFALALIGLALFTHLVVRPSATPR
jgi:predicted MFS family arabinose efflux permease